MHFIEFEEQNFQYWDRLFIVDERGEGLYGNYLGEYSQPNRTFLFMNSGNGQREIKHIDDMQIIRRV
jgi:hypothetical protein